MTRPLCEPSCTYWILRTRIRYSMVLTGTPRNLAESSFERAAGGGSWAEAGELNLLMASVSCGRVAARPGIGSVGNTVPAGCWDDAVLVAGVFRAAGLGVEFVGVGHAPMTRSKPRSLATHSLTIPRPSWR